MRRRIYLASSWRNPAQPMVLQQLRADGHEVYDFRNPRPGDEGFRWSEIDGGWQTWTPTQYLAALDHPIARAGFASDWNAMQWADSGVLLLPCGRSAHLEAGYFVGAGKELYVLFSEAPQEPELMYRMATGVYLHFSELLGALGRGEVAV